jgi:hypothetical protein
MLVVHDAMERNLMHVRRFILEPAYVLKMDVCGSMSQISSSKRLDILVSLCQFNIAVDEVLGFAVAALNVHVKMVGDIWSVHSWIFPRRC